MEHILDAIGVIGNVSWHLLALLALLGIVLGMNRLKAFSVQLEELFSVIRQIGQATLDDKGKPLLDYHTIDETRRLIAETRDDLTDHSIRSLKHFDDIARVADEDKYRNCDIQRCVHFQSVIHKIERILDRFDQFDRRAEENRTTTSTSLLTIQQGQKDLGSELGNLAKTMITVLTDFIRERSR